MSYHYGQPVLSREFRRMIEGKPCDRDPMMSPMRRLLHEERAERNRAAFEALTRHAVRTAPAGVEIVSLPAWLLDGG